MYALYFKNQDVRPNTVGISNALSPGACKFSKISNLTFLDLESGPNIFGIESLFRSHSMSQDYFIVLNIKY